MLLVSPGHNSPALTWTGKLLQPKKNQLHAEFTHLPAFSVFPEEEFFLAFLFSCDTGPHSIHSFQNHSAIQTRFLFPSAKILSPEVTHPPNNGRAHNQGSLCAPLSSTHAWLNVLRKHLAWIRGGTTPHTTNVTTILLNANNGWLLNICTYCFPVPDLWYGISREISIRECNSFNLFVNPLCVPHFPLFYRKQWQNTIYDARAIFMVTQILNQKAFTKPRWKKYTENRKITQYAEKTEENIKECRNFFFFNQSSLMRRQGKTALNFWCSQWSFLLFQSYSFLQSNHCIYWGLNRQEQL